MSALAPVIPADILYVAQHICGYVEAMPSEGNVNVIAGAILAERERCAQIAEAVDTKRGNEAFIAHAIRNHHSLPTSSPVADSHATTPPPSSRGPQLEGI